MSDTPIAFERDRASEYALTVEVGEAASFHGLTRLRLDGTGLIVAEHVGGATEADERPEDEPRTHAQAEPKPRSLRGQVAREEAGALLERAARFPWGRAFPSRPGIPDEAVVVWIFETTGRRATLKAWLRDVEKNRDMAPVSTSAASLAIVVGLTVLGPDAVLARRSITIRMPAFDVPPHSNRETCTFVPVPSREPVNVIDVIFTNLAAKGSFVTHHAIAYVYVDDLAPLGDIERKVVDDPICVTFGGGGAGKLQTLALAQGRKARFPTPSGTAFRLTPGTLANGKQALGLIINAHWINATDKVKRARAKVKLKLAKDSDVKRHLKPIFEAVAAAMIKVPPGRTRTAEYRWAPGNPGLSMFGFRNCY
jgi:hypothetical protein